MICSRQLRNKSLICYYYDLLCQEWGTTSWKHDCHGFCSKWDLVSTCSLNWFKNHVKSSLAELLELNQKTSSCQAGWPNPGSKHAKAGDQTLVCTFRRIPLSQEVLIVIYHDWTGWYKLNMSCNPLGLKNRNPKPWWWFHDVKTFPHFWTSMPELAYQTLEAPFGAFLFFKRFIY